MNCPHCGVKFAQGGFIPPRPDSDGDRVVIMTDGCAWLPPHMVSALSPQLIRRINGAAAATKEKPNA